MTFLLFRCKEKSRNAKTVLLPSSWLDMCTGDRFVSKPSCTARGVLICQKSSQVYCTLCWHAAVPAWRCTFPIKPHLQSADIEPLPNQEVCVGESSCPSLMRCLFSWSTARVIQQKHACDLAMKLKLIQDSLSHRLRRLLRESFLAMLLQTSSTKVGKQPHWHLGRVNRGCMRHTSSEFQGKARISQSMS